MSYQGAEGGAIPKERQKDGSPYKDLDETMDPDMKSVHVHKTDFPTPSWESTRTLESDRELSILKNLHPRSVSHMSTSVQSAQSGNSSIDPSHDGDQTRDERIHQERSMSPTPSYLSMKSDTSMSTPLSFEGNLTQKQEVLLERAESPTLSYASANSHQSMDTDEEVEEENSAPKENIIRPEEVVCDVCEVQAVKFCQTCTLSYCGTHVKKHYTLPKLQTHTLVDVTGDLEERLCQEHHRALEVFCRKDQKLICSLCVVTTHKGHDVVYEEIKQSGRQTFDRDQCQRLKLASVDEVLSPPGEIQFLSVTSDSVSLSWGSPEGQFRVFRVTWGCDGEERSLMVEDGCNVEIDGLQPGKKYQFSVATEGEDGRQSRRVSASVFTVVPAPRDLQINQSGATSFTVSWTKAEELEKVPQRFLISYCSPGSETRAANTEDSYRTLSGLLPGTQYTISVSTVLNNGKQSKPLSTTICTIIPVPIGLTVDSVDTTSAAVSWSQPPGLDQTQHHYQISYHCPGTEPHITTTSSHSITLSDLKPATEYSVTVCTVLENGVQGQLISTTFTTKIPAPDELTIDIDQLQTTTLTVRWTKAHGMDRTPHCFHISYSSTGTDSAAQAIRTEDCHTTLSDLRPGTKYTVSVSTVVNNGEHSESVSATICTVLPAPDQLTVDSVGTTSAAVSWNQPPGLDQTQYHYQISYHCPGTEPHITTTSSHSITLSDLKCGTQYSVTVCTVLEDGKQSQPVSTTFNTKLTLKLFMQKLGLTQHFEEKLSLNDVLAIDSLTLGKNHTVTPQSLPWCFLKELMRMNVSARDVKYITTDKEDLMKVNPLDLITALFLCSDGFLQQEIVQKMSMCQFAVPLLLPNCDTKQSTLMLWALSDIVKKFRPSSPSDSKSFKEERIVISNIPMVSFVRLGESSLSKSQILNKLLSNPQQYHDTFVHHNMEGGNVPRTIADGLVEISWYFPCGNRNIDMFTKPVSVANLRGDIKSFETQFSFLCQTSAAVYIFSDDLESDLKVLKTKDKKAELFLVVSSQKKTFTEDTLRKFTTEFGIKPTNVIVKENKNYAEFVITLQSSVGDIIETSPNRLTIENMVTVARQSGILVDEDCDECQSARKTADEITRNITDTIQFKDKQLPLQGKIWKELSQLEKERCRLRKRGDQDIEHYKSSLKKKEEELRKEQNTFDMSDAMASFILGMSSSGAERSYFLKWMRINLDNLSRQNLSGLRDRYKDLCQHSPEKKDDIKDLDKQLSDCSLGLEHFLRELGQLYEAACSLPESSPQRKQMEHLPGLCAQMLLDGFPIELVDGDASNIPLKWISAVLTQLHTLVDSNSKIRVVTVLGVQSTGKSTLLNTMFGVQFAVSSGRCTRGAFMLLIKVNKELKEELKCDFIMVIDTEGLKSPELAQLDDSYEHDNELATLVIGLSDVTIINIAMENNTEMKDVLQIVVHAFIRMKEVGKKPVCHFVHQNVSDMSAHDNNMRDRKKLLEQLNEMTQAAARMEKKDNITKFTDVMEYDPDTSSCYIPGLWHGTPPMAPVNSGYSEAVYNFKKSLVEDSFKFPKKDDLTHFMKWTESLWESVKFENFIFSFKNSLFADAYSKLCTEYNGWEWAFQKEMESFMFCAENKISNFGMAGLSPTMSIVRDLLKILMREANKNLEVGEMKIQDNLMKYFAKQDDHVNLVERYKEGFKSSATMLRRETENTVRNTLYGAVEIKEGMIKVDDIKRSQAKTMEKKVLALLQDWRQKNIDLSDQALREEFERMWNETLSEINFKGLPRQDVDRNAINMLNQHFSRRGSHVKSMLDRNLVDCGKFVVESVDWWRKAEGFAKHGDHGHHRKKLQLFCDDIITECQEFINEKVKGKSDYHDTYIKDLLNRIEETLKNPETTNVSEECELSLKLHICCRAASEFQKMHEDFIAVNDPMKCLEQSKSKYLTEFIDLFHNRDQCLKKAEEFSKLLRPAVQDYVTKMIGPDVVDEMKTGKGSQDYSTRASFQFSILKQLLVDGEYENYREYIIHYEKFVKKFLSDQIVERLSEGRLAELEKKHLTEIVNAITDAISEVRNTIDTQNGSDVKTFIQNICSVLEDKLSLKDALDSIMILKPANTEQFSNFLIESVRKMEQSLASEYERGRETTYDKVGSTKERLQSLPFKPQDKMFTSLFGCGKQCPFCGAPCEAGGKEHAEHFTSIHRPQGLNGVKLIPSNKLVTNICSSDVTSNLTFITTRTGENGHPFKDYQKYYTDWIITGDSSIKASDYWKYVMATFNERIAKDRDSTLPADLPEDWKALTRDDAMKSLKETFNMK
ncbi:interferon-induced very large GTPase 1-like isoform X2 [Salvelinus sp. IW2-2015]|uniref:interferon-induced very large GTPase 1-like isoform X2 n=1 Tax=Salvelinus sp. IW2-2015 TaxID=2691554 RepID=UPI0038D4EBB9